MIRTVLRAIITLATVAYPALWWFARDNSVHLTALGGLMCLLWLIRTIIDRGNVIAKAAPYVSVLFGVCAVAGSAGAFMWYPLVLNFTLLLVFAFSLRKTPLIEVFARLRHSDLPDEAKPYLRRVTEIWVVYFILNGSVIAALSALRMDAAWALYTGVISYLLMGAVLGGEWLYRTAVLKKRIGGMK